MRIQPAASRPHALDLAGMLDGLRVPDPSGDVLVLLLVGFGLGYLAFRLAALWQWQRPVYLLNFQVFKPPERMRTDEEIFMNGAGSCQEYTKESLDFMRKMIQRSGVGPKSYMPDALHEATPWNAGIGPCRTEAELVMCSVVDQALKAAKIKPSEVGILVTNCSIFCPTPSLSAMLINRFKFKSDIISFNLGGMGCSAGLLSMALVQDLLQVHPGKVALVVSTENITTNLYLGNNRPMLVPACIFRLGGAAVLLSNKPRDRRRAKYELTHLVRTNAAADDDAYRCVYQEEDRDGVLGVNLSKELISVAGRTLKANITKLAPQILPISEKLAFVHNLFLRKVLKQEIKPYTPNFAKAVDHFCIHTGGRAVLEGMETQLRLSPALMEPSWHTLWRMGNTSSASIWYVLAYIETSRGVRKGDKVWQLAFGSGFKVNSAILRARRNTRTQHEVFQEEQGGAA